MTKQQAKEFALDFMKKHPQFTEEVKDLWSLMNSEIEEGGSEQHEINLFIGSCEELLTEEK